jgi:hypothetical protein
VYNHSSAKAEGRGERIIENEPQALEGAAYKSRNAEAQKRWDEIPILCFWCWFQVLVGVEFKYMIKKKNTYSMQTGSTA